MSASSSAVALTKLTASHYCESGRDAIMVGDKFVRIHMKQRPQNTQAATGGNFSVNIGRRLTTTSALH